MRYVIVSLLLLGAAPGAALAQTPAVGPAASGHYTVDSTNIGTLLDDPAARAALEKRMPGFTTNPQIDMARSMTLKGIQQYSPDKITDASLANIQADLNALPMKK